jgi:2-dehydro-3-deoxygluconokinase
MRNKYITFGEIMLRISPSYKGDRIFRTRNFTIEPGGSESNVSVALANLGFNVEFVTSIPDNDLKIIILRYLKKYGIGVENIVFLGKRIGLYWTENGISVRPSKVLYDRQYSAFYNSKYEDYCWEKIFRNGKWLHVSGITAALSSEKCKMLENILEYSKSNNLINSIDLNYRGKLWNWVRSKSDIHKNYNQICTKADLIIGNETDYYDCIGISKKPREIMIELFKIFPKLKYAAISLRESLSASENKWKGIFSVKNNKIEFYESAQYLITDIVDRVGAGDCFSAGIIYGISKFKSDFQKVVDFAVSISCLKHTIRGDSCEFTEDDVVNFIETKGSGRIQR